MNNNVHKIGVKNQRPVGWGIIGLGNHVEQRMLPALKKASYSKIVAVCSRSLEKAQHFARLYEIEFAYDSFTKMLENQNINALLIATPNYLHAEQTVMAANAGKNVLCEKPMALTEADCERMIEVCSKKKVKLSVVFQNRYHPAHVEVHHLIQSGELGEISLAKAQYCTSMLGKILKQGWRSDINAAGGGALMGTGLHPIDLMRFLLDSEIIEIRAFCEPQPSANTVDEMIYLISKFSNGTTGIVISGALFRSDNDVVLYSNRAKVVCKGTLGMSAEGELIIEGDSLDNCMSFPTDNPSFATYVSLMEAFNRCIQENTEPDITGYDGLQMCRIANAVLESSRLGKAIEIDGVRR